MVSLKGNVELIIFRQSSGRYFLSYCPCLTESLTLLTFDKQTSVQKVSSEETATMNFESGKDHNISRNTN